MPAAPPAVPADSLHLVDRIVERNARLIVRLTQVQRELHEQLHNRKTLWTKCVEISCRATCQAIEKNTLEAGV